MDWMREFTPERKADWGDIAAEVRESVAMDDVIRAYTPGITIRNRRCPCPFHNGKDFNFSFTRTGYKCFVCGASGDVISYAKDILGLRSRTDAIKQLNADFCLNLPINGTISAIQSADLALKRAEREKKEKAHAEWEENYHSLWAEWIACDNAKRTADPESSEYATAVKRIDYIAYLIDNLPSEPR